MEKLYPRNTIEAGLSTNNPKPIWQYVKVKKQDNSGVAPLKINGCLVCDAKSKANILVDQFHSVFTRQTPTNHLPKLPEHPPTPALCIRQEGVAKLLKRINSHKAPGPDQIPIRILKECSSELAPGLTCIFQTVSAGCLPQDWTNANISRETST